MKIPFDIKYRPQIENGKVKVETSIGLPVKILYWDARSAGRENDIIALVENPNGTQKTQRYYANGHLIADSINRGDKDLVIITPENLSSFEKMVKVKLLEANKKLNNGEELDETYIKSAAADMKDELFKKLPEWKIAERDIDCDTLEFLIKFKHDGGDGPDWESIEVTNRLHKGEKYIEIYDLEQLPKSE
jgi:hypothetical protein